MSGGKSVRDVGLARQLFVDDYVVEQMANVSRVLNPVEKHRDNPLLTAEAAWEDAASMSVATALYDRSEKRFRMWYTVPGGVCYAASPDGLRWERPTLGLSDFRGSAKNNLAAGLPGPTEGIVYSPEMVGSELPEKYYKSLCREEHGWAVYYSGDGLTWTAGTSNPVLTAVVLGDVCSTGKSSQDFPQGVFYKKTPPPKYLAFPQFRVRVGRFERRCVGFSGCPMTFPDTFAAWPVPSLVLAPDPLDDELADERLTAAADTFGFDSLEDRRSEFCGMTGFCHEGAFLGLLWVFHAGVQSGTHGADVDGIVDVQLTSSRDLVHWQRAGEREPFIPLGSPGDWDSGQIQTANSPIVVGDEIWIYYTGRSFSHSSALLHQSRARKARRGSASPLAGIGLAKLRLDRFVSLDAGEVEGTVTTRPLQFDGRELVINAQACEGSVAVEILSRGGAPIEGFSAAECDLFTGDAVRHTVTWQGNSDLSALRAEPIRLRFHLRRASLYSFAFSGWLG